jgi:hypothetical protein
MSGGHFGNCGYDYYKVAQFADELEEEILKNGKKREDCGYYGEEYYPTFEPETIKYLRKQLLKMRKMAEIMRHIDYLYSGDHGEDSFMWRVKEVEKHWGECEDLATRMDEWNETGDGV